MKHDKELKRIAHDIRGQLGVILSFLDLSGEAQLDESQKILLSNAKQSMSKVGGLIDSLTKIAKEIKEPLDEKKTTSPSKSKKNILVIDDDQSIRTQWQKTLKDHGMEVLSLSCGEELLNMNLDISAFTMAIVDFHYENSSLDGFDIVEYLKSQELHNIHLCTGNYDDEAVTNKARDLGITSVIAKPLAKDIWKAVT
jgi:CheY-like chemotaxis protein